MFSDLDQSKTWPHDDRYICTKCSACGSAYLGPKRSPTCWSCASQQTQDWWQSVNAPKTEQPEGDDDADQ
jgi:uncharacterized OB-fold protein